MKNKIIYMTLLVMTNVVLGMEADDKGIEGTFDRTLQGLSVISGDNKGSILPFIGKHTGDFIEFIKQNKVTIEQGKQKQFPNGKYGIRIDDKFPYVTCSNLYNADIYRKGVDTPGNLVSTETIAQELWGILDGYNKQHPKQDSNNQQFQMQQQQPMVQQYQMQQQKKQDMPEKQSVPKLSELVKEWDMDPKELKGQLLTQGIPFEDDIFTKETVGKQQQRDDFADFNKQMQQMQIRGMGAIKVIQDAKYQQMKEAFKQIPQDMNVHGTAGFVKTYHPIVTQFFKDIGQETNSTIQLQEMIKGVDDFLKKAQKEYQFGQHKLAFNEANVRSALGKIQGYAGAPVDGETGLNIITTFSQAYSIAFDAMEHGDETLIALLLSKLDENISTQGGCQPGFTERFVTLLCTYLFYYAG
ncbi:MAG: hypothetical protein ACTSXG_04355 [Alphaproteobacteria bacterium]